MFLKYNIWGIIWIILIFILCSLPGKQLPPGPFINFDKLVHLFFYSALTILLLRGFVLQNRFAGLKKNHLLISFLIGAIYGAFIEVWQGYILKNRGFDVNDILANIAGAILGILLWLIFLKKFFAKAKKS